MHAQVRGSQSGKTTFYCNKQLDRQRFRNMFRWLMNIARTTKQPEYIKQRNMHV